MTKKDPELRQKVSATIATLRARGVPHQEAIQQAKILHGLVPPPKKP